MPRPHRVQIAGGLYHIATRSSDKRAILRDDVDRERLLGLVERGCARSGWLCHDYCLLTTHYHLLVTTPKENLARGMQWLNGLYGATFNERHAAHGHVFGGRYSSTLVESDAHLLYLVSYLAMNPVLAGLCRDPAEWPWSSYPALIGRAPAGFLHLEEVLRLFAFDPDQARLRIEQYVAGNEFPALAA
jgi:REP element-mobilizing transposase RayT